VLDMTVNTETLSPIAPLRYEELDLSRLDSYVLGSINFFSNDKVAKEFATNPKLVSSSSPAVMDPCNHTHFRFSLIALDIEE